MKTLLPFFAEVGFTSRNHLSFQWLAGGCDSISEFGFNPKTEVGGDGALPRRGRAALPRSHSSSTKFLQCGGTSLLSIWSYGASQPANPMKAVRQHRPTVVGPACRLPVGPKSFFP